MDSWKDFFSLSELKISGDTQIHPQMPSNMHGRLATNRVCVGVGEMRNGRQDSRRGFDEQGEVQ